MCVRYLYNVCTNVCGRSGFCLFLRPMVGYLVSGPLERGEERVRGAWDELMLSFSFTVWWAQRARATVPVELE